LFWQENKATKNMYVLETKASKLLNSVQHVDMDMRESVLVLTVK